MIWTLSSVERRDKLLHLCGQVYDRFVQFAFNSKISASTDSVYEYTMLLLHLCLFYAEFADGIREGDGDRVLRCWKYMLPIFSSSGNTNYACEAANLVVQQMYTLSPRLAAGDALSMYMVGNSFGSESEYSSRFTNMELVEPVQPKISKFAIYRIKL